MRERQDLYTATWESGLSRYERQALDALKQQFTVEDALVVCFARSLDALKHLFERVTIGDEGEFREGRVVVMGFINHTHHLFVGGLHSLQAGNGPVWSACVRGLMETFGACVLVSEHPGTAPNYLRHVKAGQLRAAAERERPGFKKDFDRLNQIVHPASRAIYAGFKATSAKERKAHITFGLRLPEAGEVRDGAAALANLVALIVEKLGQLSSHAEVLRAGKLIMVRTNWSTDHQAEDD